MATYRRFHKEFKTLSPVNQSRIRSDQRSEVVGAVRPQIVKAVQWRTGNDTLGLADRWLGQLEDGDYIVIDFPDYPWVWKQADFEENTEFIAD